MLHVEATIWNKDRDPRLAFTMQIDLDNPVSDLRSPCDDDPVEADVGASGRRGCANNRVQIVLRWTDREWVGAL